MREVFEEASITITEASLIPGKVFETTDSDGRWVVIPYKVSVGSTDVVVSAEHSEFRWATQDELLSMPDLGNDFRQMLFV